MLDLDVRFEIPTLQLVSEVKILSLDFSGQWANMFSFIKIHLLLDFVPFFNWRGFNWCTRQVSTPWRGPEGDALQGEPETRTRSAAHSLLGWWFQAVETREEGEGDRKRQSPGDSLRICVGCNSKLSHQETGGAMTFIYWSLSELFEGCPQES